MIKGIGIDIIEIQRVKAAALRRPRFLERIFTPEELQYCLAKDNPWPSLAARFAAKEATMKAMGVGLGAFPWQDIEVAKEEHHVPVLKLSGKGLSCAQKQGITHWHLSLSHNRSEAIAFVVAERRLS